jgi:hypothetical protein
MEWLDSVGSSKLKGSLRTRCACLPREVEADAIQLQLSRGGSTEESWRCSREMVAAAAAAAAAGCALDPRAAARRSTWFALSLCGRLDGTHRQRRLQDKS